MFNTLFRLNWKNAFVCDNEWMQSIKHTKISLGYHSFKSCFIENKNSRINIMQSISVNEKKKPIIIHKEVAFGTETTYFYCTPIFRTLLLSDLVYLQNNFLFELLVFKFPWILFFSHNSHIKIIHFIYKVYLISFLFVIFKCIS